MFNPPTVIAVFCVYIALLFMVALWVERKAATGKDVGNNPVIYSLSLAVYLTAWTFYGSVGNAATSGMLFFTFYLGPTVGIVLWWIVLRKMVRIRNTYRITSIADFISVRYDKSRLIAALVTVIAIAGIVPYVALQLKAIFSTFEIITNPLDQGYTPWVDLDIGLIIVGMMTIFTIIFGVRRLVPTERHQGMVVVLAVESAVKLVAFLAVGVFVTYFLFGGFTDIFSRLSELPIDKLFDPGKTDSSFYFTWATYMLLSMSAVMFLPRQFHLSVVENFNENHIRTAMWLFPVYMLLMSIFIYPVAMGGLLMGLPVQDADKFVLSLPFSSGHRWLSLFVFIGGFSAATGMIMICSMTVSTMFTNHLLLPVIEWVKRWGFLKRYLLQCRWISVAAFILAGYWFERRVGEYYMLVSIGMISFAAVLQFVPAIIGGLFWKKGNKTGALLGMGTGFVVWLYTLIIPALAKSGWVPLTLLENGPWGIEILKPEHLFGVTGLDYLSHAVLWTMIFNIGLYVIGSVYFAQTEEEQNLSEEFVNALAVSAAPLLPTGGEALVNQAEKKRGIEELLCQYFPHTKAAEIIDHCLCTLEIDKKEEISIIELAELHNEVERHLAGSIGTAAAHHAIRKSAIFSPKEEIELKKAYAEIIAELRLTPGDLKDKIDHYRDREKLLTLQAGELEEKVRERDDEIMERKRVEEALRESERKFRAIFEQTFQFMGLMTSDGTLIEANKTALELIGYKGSDVLGKPFWDTPWWTHSKDLQETLRSAVEKAAKGEFVRFEATHTASDGKIHYVDFSLKPVKDETGNVVLVIPEGRDVTDRKQAEEALKESERRLANIIGFLPEATFVINRDGIVIAWNRAIETMTGVRAEDILGKGDYEYATPFYGERRPILIDLVLQPTEEIEKKYVNIERRPDGSLVGEAHIPHLRGGGLYFVGTAATLYDFKGNLVGAIEAISDITDRKQAEEALRESERRLANIIDFLPDATFVIDREGRVIAWNRAIEAMTGIKSKDILGKGDYEYALPFYGERRPILIDLVLQPQEEFEKRYANIERKPVGTLVGEGYIPYLKGGEFYFLGTAAPLYDFKSNLVGAIQCIGDITERRRVEIELRKHHDNLEDLVKERTAELAIAKERAEESDRLKSAFLATMSHELRTPLNSVIGFTGILLQDLVGPLNNEQRKQLNMVKNSANHLLNLINDVLDLSKIESGRMGLHHEVFEMDKLIDKTVLSMKPMAERKNLVLISQVEPEVGQITSDPRRVQQILVNFINNAIKFTDRGEVHVECRVRDGWLNTTVSDTGIGIKPEEMEHLFQTFRQIDSGLARQREGSGLGLAICKRLAEALGGKIQVESLWSAGSAFTLMLPVEK
jgi:PAS domain S-box-containing protein